MGAKNIRISITSALNAAGIEATKQQVDAMSKSVAKSMAGAAAANKAHWADIKAACDMGVGAIRKIAGVFQSVMKKAFDLENIIIGFKTLIGSIDEAKNHVADLRSFASQTPLTFADLSNASKTLLSFGTNVKDVMPSLKMLGDISLGNSEKFKSLALVFGQVRSAGRLMGQDLLQMINQGFNPLTIISQKTGASMADLKKMMESGAISFEMVEAAMRAATSEGGMFNNAMKNASETGAGMVSTLQDNWTQAVETFGAAFLSASKDGLGSMIEKLQELNNDGTIEVWANKTKQALDDVVEASKAVGQALKWVWEKSGASDVWNVGKGLIQSVGASTTRAVAGIANGEGIGQALSEANKEGGSAFAKAAARGHWIGKLSSGGYLGDGMKWAAEDNERDDEFENEQAKKIQSAKKIEKEKAKAAAEEKKTATEKQKTIEELFNKAKEESDKKAAEKKAEAEKKAAEKAAAAQARLDKEAAAARERQAQKELDQKIKNHQKLLAAENKAESEAHSRQAKAESKLQQAWGWYRDKDSMRAQLEEEKADAAARKQFDKDFEKLKSKHRDWRTVENLSVDDEAVRRVALAREEKQAADKHLAEIEKNTAGLSAKLDELMSMK